MPLYEYRRPDGSTFEIVQSFADDALTADPETGVPVTRVLHAPAIHFKGKGFYATDVGREKQRRLLDREAERGANEHDEKFRAREGARVREANSPNAKKTKPAAKKAP